MIPAKNRDRKCSTCRHYQPSPLWRKGWCRNPLLYDRNTNHLVESDSLACNRTFIDYWEPVTEGQQQQRVVGPQPRGTKPRIAPSIPMTTTDPKGQRGVVTGNTPVSGMTALSSAPQKDQEVQAQPQVAPYISREVPKLALVTPDYDPYLGEAADDPKLTKQIEQVPGPADDHMPHTTSERIKRARQQARARMLQSPRMRIVMIAVGVIALAALVGATLLLTNRPTTKGNSPAAAAAHATAPLPTPTGFGDATATPPPAPTVALPPAGVIALNGWVQVQTDSLSVRSAPGTSGRRVTTIPSGTKAHVVDGPKDANNLTWWKIDHFDPKNPSASGWSAAKYLKATTAP